jgi:hypothetical protein
MTGGTDSGIVRRGADQWDFDPWVFNPPAKKEPL